MNLKKEIEKIKNERLKNRQKKPMLQIYLEKKLIKELDEIKKKYKTTRSEIIRQLLKNYILEESK